ncbi:ER membrane protein complex subunit 10 [Senna tora]|uniref:ER membrane protein complex subunit 10 n=1 Tax=Senna tora TaxID=362788 RepID=A0A834THY3_9FABA|nr:ER membrane protein complex subunit 10 [Senna tora]
MGIIQLVLTLIVCLSLTSSLAFQSDELLIDDDEFILEGGPPRIQSSPSTTTFTSRKRLSDSGSDSKIQFDLEHAFGDSQFSDAGNFSARLKTWNHGGQTLTKLRFSRNGFNEVEQKNFKKLLQEDDFYKIRLPSNVLSPPGRDYIISSVKARCLTGEGLEENFVIHTISLRWDFSYIFLG